MGAGLSLHLPPPPRVGDPLFWSPGFLILCASSSLVTISDLEGGLGREYHSARGLPSFLHWGGG